METRTIFWLVIVGLILAIAIVSVMSKKKKKTSTHDKKDGDSDTKAKEHGGSIFMTIVQIICFVIFIGLLIYVIVDYYQEKVYPWDEEVKVELRKKITETTLEEMAVFQTPRTIKFDYAFDIETNGRPYAILWSGTNVPICYCDDDKKDPYIRKRNKGPNTITKPSKECWKMCKN